MSKREISHTDSDVVHEQEISRLSATSDNATVDVNSSESTETRLIIGVQPSLLFPEATSHLGLAETDWIIPSTAVLGPYPELFAHSNRSLTSFSSLMSNSTVHVLPDDHAHFMSQSIAPIEASTALSLSSQDGLPGHGARIDTVDPSLTDVCPFVIDNLNV
jgi:hypothetical protein